MFAIQRMFEEEESEGEGSESHVVPAVGRSGAVRSRAVCARVR